MYNESTNWAMNPKTNFILSFWIKKGAPDWSAFYYFLYKIVIIVLLSKLQKSLAIQSIAPIKTFQLIVL